MAPAPEAGPLGILGGTFDPVHLGHLRLAEEAREALALVRVIFVPTGTPPHRAAPRTDKRHRLAMVRRAIDGNAAFALDDGEIQAEGPSYTVTTLARLRAGAGAARSLVLLMGADAFLGLASWHRWQEIFELAHVAVATRPGTTLAAQAMAPELAAAVAARRAEPGALADGPAGAIAAFALTPLDVSASRIRADLAAGRSARYLAPDPVLDYIRRHHLYRPS